MTRSELLPCRCGSPAEIDWGGCTEIAGMCWQVLTISCTNPEQYACYREMTAEIDGDTDSGREVEDALVAAWNRRAPARELDAAKGGVCCYPDCNCPFDHPGTPGWCARGLAATPPAQAAESVQVAYNSDETLSKQAAEAVEAVERVARAMASSDGVTFGCIPEHRRANYYALARAAIAAMQAGEGE